MSLEPDAFLAASATMRVRERLDLVIARLKREAGWTDRPHKDEPDRPTKCLVTSVPSRDVVDAALVKKEVALGGYDSSMEAMLDDLLAEMAIAHRAAEDAELPFRPRAIHVCQTNVNVDDGTKELPNKPFVQRRVPPILIWKHLVARGVNPSKIAVYADLAVDKRSFPLPEEFILYAGGDRDFAAFSREGYEHIIFNQALQEGWDDPQVAFAYIDKTMGSSTQVEQVIGRVLRQPGVQHYADAVLNRATFFIRLDDRQQFQDILEEVKKRLGTEPGGIAIRTDTTQTRLRARQEVRKSLSVPYAVPVSDEAAERMDELLARTPDYTAGGPDIIGRGTRERALLSVGSAAAVDIDTTDIEHSSMVTARWLMSREMRALYPRALAAIEVADRRLDALVERTSIAAEAFRKLGRDLVATYLDYTTLVIEPANPYVVRAIEVDPNTAVNYTNAAHEAYSLNSLELPIGRAIDATGHDWCRNPENGGWNLPLLQAGGSRRFFPDFLVWKGRDIFAIDPKGPHILKGDAGRKVMAVNNAGRGVRVFTRLISAGRWNQDITEAGPGGFTVWSWDTSSGRLRQRHYANAALAVAGALRP
jgi:type III restriction enzyme